LQSQVEDLQVQLRAVTELISLQEVRTGESSPVASTHFPAFSFDNTQNQILLIIAAIGLASLLMYAWDQWKGRKPAVVSVRTAAPAPRVTTEKLTQMAHAMPSDVYEGDPPSDPVQTKLDLARAYIDIGDKVSAREILLEVIQEGNASQKMSAEVLITQMD
jgi:FimV-like protein